MRAAGRPSFLKEKDSGHVAAARTLAQGAGRRTTVAWTRRRIVAMPDEYAALQKINEAAALSLSSVRAFTPIT